MTREELQWASIAIYTTMLSHRYAELKHFYGQEKCIVEAARKLLEAVDSAVSKDQI